MKIKHFKKSLYPIWSTILISLLFMCCSKDNGSEKVAKFSYLSESFEVSFRTQGTIPGPVIEWSGDEGSFALKTDIPGLTINETTGEILWERQLNIGEHQIEIIAQNDQQVLETSLLLTNVLKASFWVSGQNGNIESEEIEFDRYFTLFEDGTLEVVKFNSPDFIGVGVWEINDNIIEIRSCLCEGVEPQAVPEYDEHTFYRGTLINEESIAYIRGEWSVIRFDPDSTTLLGNFYLEWD